jgi:ribosomal protein S18 acetylase RimI-like enzyme
MYVSPTHRGLGLGRRILEELHRVAAESGCRATRLDTSDYLIAAIGLYRAAGYHEVADYNGNTKASLWFERPLP